MTDTLSYPHRTQTPINLASSLLQSVIGMISLLLLLNRNL